MRLPWWGFLFVIVGAIPLFLLFAYFGKSAIARPTLYSVAIIVIAIAMRWRLRKHVWFWITIALIAAVHVPLILFIPWSTRWVPVIVIIPIAMADLYVMLWILSVVGRFVSA